MTEFSEDELIRLRAVFGRMARVFTGDIETGGLTRTQLSILASVVRHGPIGLSELADIEGINPTMLSRIVGKLDAAGLISRSPDEADRRAARVRATPAGLATHRQLLADRATLLAGALAKLEPAEVRRILDALTAMESLVGYAKAEGNRSDERDVAAQA